MKNFFYLLLIALTFSSCSDYQKALKSEDKATKLKMGNALFDKGKYNKANRLFAQVVPNYRGKPQAERLMYMYSKSFYLMEDYYTAAYQFERFADGYPKSQKAEEAAFLSAKSHYLLSPVFSKEQKETKTAIEKLQLFINKYPESQYLADANTLVKELDYKLEKKAYSIAKQYNKVSDYKASIKSFDLFILEYPGTNLREKAMFYRLDAAYKLAINSVEWKKEERLKVAQTYFNGFSKAYPNSEHNEEAAKIAETVQQELQKFSTKS